MIDAAEFEKYKHLKQQVLPFDFWEEEEKQKQEARQKAEEQMPHFECPRNDKEKLLELQYQYKHGRPEALNEMYGISVEICMKIINVIARSNSHVRRLSMSERRIKARDATTYLIEQYLTRDDFIIKTNVPGYLFLRVEKELFYQRKVDTIVDFVDLALFFKEGEEDQDENEGK